MAATAGRMHFRAFEANPLGLHRWMTVKYDGLCAYWAPFVLVAMHLVWLLSTEHLMHTRRGGHSTSSAASASVCGFCHAC